MVSHLLRDLIYRNRAIYALPLVVSLMWMTVAAGIIPGHRSITIALMMTLLIGPMTAVTGLGLREIRYLPTRYSDLWTATWLASTVVAAGVVLIAASLGTGLVLFFRGSVELAMETPFLVALYSFVYANVGLLFTPVLNHVAQRVHPGRLKDALLLALLVGFCGALAVPYYFSAQLPLAFDEFTPTSVIALLVCIGLAFCMLAWQPAAGLARPGRVPPTDKRRLHPRFSDRATGISRVMLPTLVGAATATAVLVCAANWYGGMTAGGDLADFLESDFLIQMAYMMIGMRTPWMPWARTLKILPMSTGSINVLLLATPQVIWAVVFCTLMILEPVVGAVAPEWFHGSTLVWFGGMSTIVNALGFRNQGSVLWTIIPTSATGPIAMGIAKNVDGMSAPWLVAAGLLAIGIAAWINHRTLTRCGSSSRAFRPPTYQPFGISGPAAPR